MAHARRHATSSKGRALSSGSWSWNQRTSKADYSMLLQNMWATNLEGATDFAKSLLEGQAGAPAVRESRTDAVGTGALPGPLPAQWHRPH
mmetsp:Transcript_69338/g.160643  ORF Transcript_69338/g.160643 Transcript_69338/m.160643 type:complete len:90 (+) Transcript_69338:32-301(+)